MKLGLFCIYDKKQKWYMSPIPAQNRADFCRRIKMDIEQKRSQELICHYPEDFDLYEMGFYDTNDGILKADGQPTFIVNVEDIIQEKVE